MIASHFTVWTLPLQSTIKSLPTKGRQRLLYDNPFRIFTVLIFLSSVAFYRCVFFPSVRPDIMSSPLPYAVWIAGVMIQLSTSIFLDRDWSGTFCFKIYSCFIYFFKEMICRAQLCFFSSVIINNDQRTAQQNVKIASHPPVKSIISERCQVLSQLGVGLLDFLTKIFKFAVKRVFQAGRVVVHFLSSWRSKS